MWVEHNLALVYLEEHQFLGIFCLNNSAKGSISHPHIWQEMVLFLFSVHGILHSGHICATLCNLKGQTLRFNEVCMLEKNMSYNC